MHWKLQQSMMSRPTVKKDNNHITLLPAVVAVRKKTKELFNMENLVCYMILYYYLRCTEKY